MARTRYSGRRGFRTSRRTTRRKAPRRYATKKRTYRKKTAMTRKRLITTMSSKKRDTMLSAAAVGVNPSPQNTKVVGQKLTINPIPTNTSAGVHMSVFMPSYRGLVPNNYSFLAARDRHTDVGKGISETYQLNPSDASMWQWRRVVVHYKGDFNNTPPSVFQNIGAQNAAGGATYRFFTDMTGDTTGGFTAFYDSVNDVLFRGILTTDWLNPLLAKIDTARVTVLSDVSRSLSSQNDSPRPRFIKTYVPVNRTLQYDDEENGTSVTPSFVAVENKIGIGNIYVFDFFGCSAPISTVSSQLSVTSQMTYYWHEK
ncbi:capsid protein [Blackfly genomovirus 7]|uniref:Capsid protein n=1 Tax=Blackfly genomovirus 7 TaxID=2586206 RepID=A0A4Y5QL31_9VIRU|nr:capsid protein [Blackfly genomovirus 7]QCX35070.1 capsid protein [Blackfly genomovirus 7]